MTSICQCLLPVPNADATYQQLYLGNSPFIRPCYVAASFRWQHNTRSSEQTFKQKWISTSSQSFSGHKDLPGSTLKSAVQPKSGNTISPTVPGPSPSPLQQSTNRPSTLPPDWDENPDFSIENFSELPSTNFGVNQHMKINDDFKEALRLIIWQFRAPVRYAFAYGSGVFPQTALSSLGSSSVNPKLNKATTEIQGGNGKMVDFIFGVSHTQHWHSINLQEHRDHYSLIGSLGSKIVSQVQDKWGAGVYFNPYVTVNGALIKYGVVNLATLHDDLSDWNTLYLAGRLQKPVKILRDAAGLRLANQINLISAVRTALLLLPETFTERNLYKTIAGISYLGDPRMSLGAENLNKVSNIVEHQLPNFRRLYSPLIKVLPNIDYEDPRYNEPGWWEDDLSINASLLQDMDPQRRGNMVRRLPRNFREKLYFRYQSKYEIPQLEFNKMMESSNDDDPSQVKKREGGIFDRRIASDDPASLNKEVSEVLTNIIKWPSYSQSIKSGVTAGLGRTSRYLSEKWEKNREGRRKTAELSDQKKAGVQKEKVD